MSKLLVLIPLNWGVVYHESSKNQTPSTPFVLYLPARLNQRLHGEDPQLRLGINICVFVYVGIIALWLIVVLLTHIINVNLIVVGKIILLVDVLSFKLFWTILISALFVFQSLGFSPLCSPILEPDLENKAFCSYLRFYPMSKVVYYRVSQKKCSFRRRAKVT